MADGISELSQSLEEFNRSKNSLEDLLANVKRAYEDLKRILPEPQQEDGKKGTTLDLQKVLLSDEDIKRVQKVLQEPKIVVVGQTNSGKSSLINELLEATVVTVDDIPCTARIVELQNGDSEFPLVEIVKNGRIIKSEQLDKKHVPPGVINLTADDRSNPDMINSLVRVKVKNAFLETGLQIVDSPGKNEYQELDELISKHVDTVLPLVVYVIEGKGLLTQSEIDDIRSLKQSVPEGNIFYAVTKCDNPAQMERKDTDPSDDDEDEVTDKATRSKLEISIRDTIYQKLLENNFLDRPIYESTNYHTLSSRYVKKYRRVSRQRSQTKETKMTMNDCQRFMDDFTKFKSSLFRFIGHQLVRSVKDAIAVLITSLLTCVDYFMDTSNTLLNNRRENARNIACIEAEEPKLYRDIMKTVQNKKDEFHKRIAKMIEDKREILLKKSAEFSYEAQFEIPEDGEVDAQKVYICQEKLRNHILAQVGDLVHSEVLKECAHVDVIFKDVRMKVKSLQERLDIDIHDALQLMFASNYKFNIKNVRLTQKLWVKIVEVIKSFITFARLAPVLSFLREKVNVLDVRWKHGVAKDVLSLLDPNVLSQAIVDGLCEHITEGHLKFQRKLADVKALHSELERLGERDRAAIGKMAPRMVRLLLQGWNIIDRHRYRTLCRGQVLGKGINGIVYACDSTGPNGERCVAKVIQADDGTMTDLAMGIHYARKLKHDNLAPIFASMYDALEDDRGKYELTVVMPRYKCDLLQILPELKSLKKRLRIALQVAQTVRYLHGLGLAHRGVCCANILLDEQHNAKVTDYGLCKPPSVVRVSFVGAPLHMAPEIVRNVEHDYRVDVYSFGILLWYLYGGKGTHPSYVYEHKWHTLTQGTLVDTASGLRPERYPTMDKTCWELMQQCWREDAFQRPTMSDVVEQLEKIIKDTK